MIIFRDRCEPLLEWEATASELEPVIIQIIADIYIELQHLQSVFFSSAPSPPLHHNMPPAAGTVQWSRSLNQRVSVLKARLDVLPVRLKGEREVLLACELAAELTRLHEQLEERVCREWAEGVQALALPKLERPLLLRVSQDVGGNASTRGDSEEVAREYHSHRDLDGLHKVASKAAVLLPRGCERLVVNFDQDLVRLLREVKYLLELEVEVPEAAMEIYKQSSLFRTQTSNLDMIVNRYNWVLDNSLEVEMPLIKDILFAVDKHLDIGTTTLCWSDPAGIAEFVTRSFVAVKELTTALELLHHNTQLIAESVTRLSPKEQMLQAQPDASLEFDGLQEAHLEAQEELVAAVDEENGRIGAIVSTIHGAVQDIHNKSEAWRRCVHM